MPFRLEHCTPSDMPRLFELISLSFAHEHEYIEAVFPAHDTPAGRAAGAERMLATMESDMYATFLKVVDDEGEMIAGAKWNLYDGTIPPEIDVSGDYWESEEEKEYAAHMFRMYLGPRRKAIRESGGRLLCEWF